MPRICRVVGSQRSSRGSSISFSPFRKRSRECPEDFEATFVALGRFECEEHYRARRDTITRWLVELGKDRLLKERAAFVAQQRASGQWITRSTKLVTHHEVKRPTVRETVHDRRRVSPTVARHAAQHLRIVRNGGMIVSPAGDGEWWVGTKRLSAAQMLDLARSRGFDDKVVIIFGEEPPLQGEGRKGVD
jgi:hypothetical protein